MPSLSTTMPQTVLSAAAGHGDGALEGLEGLAQMLDWRLVLADMKQSVPVRGGQLGGRGGGSRGRRGRFRGFRGCNRDWCL
eukprot:1782405-Pyramimonas_sp.AAC.1